MRKLLGVITVVHSAAFVVVGSAFFIGPPQAAWFLPVFTAVALGNGILFLLYYRHMRRNPAITPEKKNRWEIALFVAMPIANLVYFRRFMQSRDAGA